MPPFWTLIVMAFPTREGLEKPDFFPPSPQTFLPTTNSSNYSCTFSEPVSVALTSLSLAQCWGLQGGVELASTHLAI